MAILLHGFSSGSPSEKLSACLTHNHRKFHIILKIFRFFYAANVPSIGILVLNTLSINHFQIERKINALSSTPTEPVKGPEIFHKSSKELYKAVAKQFGVTCKMSDQCRCLDCQSHYFDCEYDQNEQEKTDGGLAAGTPMFISEVMHGTACRIL